MVRGRPDYTEVISEVSVPSYALTGQSYEYYNYSTSIAGSATGYYNTAIGGSSTHDLYVVGFYVSFEYDAVFMRVGVGTYNGAIYDEEFANFFTTTHVITLPAPLKIPDGYVFEFKITNNSAAAHNINFGFIAFKQPV